MKGPIDLLLEQKSAQMKEEERKFPKIIESKLQENDGALLEKLLRDGSVELLYSALSITQEMLRRAPIEEILARMNEQHRDVRFSSIEGKEIGEPVRKGVRIEMVRAERT